MWVWERAGIEVIRDVQDELGVQNVVQWAVMPGPDGRQWASDGARSKYLDTCSVGFGWVVAPGPEPALAWV